MAGILVADGGRGFTRGSAAGQRSSEPSHTPLAFLLTVDGDEILDRERLPVHRVRPVLLHPLRDQTPLKHSPGGGREDGLLWNLVTNCRRRARRRGSTERQLQYISDRINSLEHTSAISSRAATCFENTVT